MYSQTTESGIILETRGCIGNGQGAGHVEGAVRRILFRGKQHVQNARRKKQELIDNTERPILKKKRNPMNRKSYAMLKRAGACPAAHRLDSKQLKELKHV